MSSCREHAVEATPANLLLAADSGSAAAAGALTLDQSTGHDRRWSHRVRMMQTAVSLIALSSVGLMAGCVSAPPRVGATPTVELAAGFNLSQLPQAEFPGPTASVAIIRPSTSTRGMAVVADVEASYLMSNAIAGVRLYGRTAPLFSDRRTVTYFAHLLAGAVQGSVQGVLRSEGGPAIEPGVGLDYGAASRAFHVQVDYRRVASGLVYDSRVPGQPVDSLSGPRVVLGMTWRLRPR